MADDVIDRLELEISSDSNSANNALDTLIGNLVSLKSHLRGLGNIKIDGLKSVSKDVASIKLNINGITEPLKDIEKIEVDTSKLRKVSNDIKKLTSIDAGAIPAVSDGIKKGSSFCQNAE